MELTKIKGNTYYINSPTRIGVYVFKNKFCLLIDSGINNSSARKIHEILKQNNLHVKYIINTHSHLDHCGGNHFFKENYPGTLVYTSSKERVCMENPEFNYIKIFSSSPMKKLTENIKPFQVDFTLDYGITKINDEKFEILPLAGHSQEDIGIITPEKVCFLGDSVFSHETLKKYPFPFLFNIETQINSLNSLKDVAADYYITGHGQEIYSKDEFNILVEKNFESINENMDFILELLDQPYTKEEILENILVYNDISLTFRRYMLDLTSISAFIAYLYDKELIDSSLENGKLYYYKK
ncbi:hydroxyacylglutathione hydrolase [Clostridium homopropionicum DSM 5847]|uniref:Hydroxyacylglutathione hydrolase n=1 Tax=Clostridium homopropionicum DSM 5847 TaxID=1121318 RepID=A0A0L6ZDY9_9CLOT|nr:MBL fold metallo-hydrolase [Clostridium homopropionicum]KOA21184.1 hydroxyacylglutathione hydrolase [Clostridium homopropionicum DSM 5847]SFG26433.1 Glyoxylase, beta-lactamase superfamily II [Clostridium homopropionicum]